jgi:hypothetical protein
MLISSLPCMIHVIIPTQISCNANGTDCKCQNSGQYILKLLNDTSTSCKDYLLSKEMKGWLCMVNSKGMLRKWSWAVIQQIRIRQLQPYATLQMIYQPPNEILFVFYGFAEWFT